MRTLTKTTSSESILKELSSSSNTIKSCMDASINLTTNIGNNLMPRNDNQSTSRYESFTKPLLNIHDVGIKVILNSIDTALREYQVRHKKLIPDAFKHFAGLCGYKAQNHFYSIFEMRPNYDLKLKDAKIIFDETHDQRILDAINDYFLTKED